MEEGSTTINIRQDSDSGEWTASFGETEGFGDSLSEALTDLAENLYLEGL
jgi:hypothetical protein